MSILYNRLLAIVKKKEDSANPAKISSIINVAEIKSKLTREELQVHYDNIFMLTYAHHTLNNKGTSLLDLPKGCKLLPGNKNNDKPPPILVRASELNIMLIKIIHEYIINPNPPPQENENIEIEECKGIECE